MNDHTASPAPTAEGQEFTEVTCSTVEQAISMCMNRKLGGAVRFMTDGSVKFIPYELMYKPSPTTNGEPG